MDSSNPISPIITRGCQSRASSCAETNIYISPMDTPNKIDMVFKITNASLVSKYVLIPDNLFTIDFDVLNIDDVFVLRNIVCFIFKTFFERTSYNKINSIAFKCFVKDVCDKYNMVSYHNFYHATHILHTTYLILDTCGLFEKLNEDILFATLLSSLVHDIGHPGNNNIFEINTCSELACRYNDLSVLEQYHCHLAFELIKKHNLFINYTQDEFILLRKTIINCILGTDMANHKSIQESMALKTEIGFNYELIEDQYLLAKIIVHAADIGNSIQEFIHCDAWARKISLEFHYQIEKEKEKGIKPFTSFNINSTTSYYSHEIKYITFISKPYWELLSDIFTDLKPLYNQINTNYDIYKTRLDELEKQYGINLNEF
jgi:high affinity cGMP-specific 3',5'-cyclic phosphodiesterase 9